jgi:hypothetical protein
VIKALIVLEKIHTGYQNSIPSGYNSENFWPFSIVTSHSSIEDNKKEQLILYRIYLVHLQIQLVTIR